MLANDIVDRIRSNPQGAAAGNYDNIDTSRGGLVTTGCLTSLLGCNSFQLSTQDIAAWAENVKDILPQGVGTVSVAANGNIMVRTTTIKWTNNLKSVSEGSSEDYNVLVVQTL